MGLAKCSRCFQEIDRPVCAPCRKDEIESLQRTLADKEAERSRLAAAFMQAEDRIVRLTNDLWELRHRVDEAQVVIARWKKAIEGLTPSGSEYVDDPERCAQHIRLRLSLSSDRLRKARTEIAALREHLAETETEIDRLKGELITAIGPDAQRHAEDL